MTDWGALYAEHVADLAGLATSLTAADRALVVPATPQWTVREVCAHLAGGPADLLSGDPAATEGAPGRRWTARHVAARAEVGLDELVTELQGHVAGVVARLATEPVHGTVWDVAVHHADLHEALGRHRLAEPLWAPVAHAVAGDRLADLPLRLTAGGATYGAPGGPPVEVDGYELFRVLFSRRSRAQVRALLGPLLSDEQLDAIGVFGPRDDDQPQPPRG